MDSLLATYASSDDEDQQPPQQPSQPQPSISLLSSLPKPQSSSSPSSLFSTLPKPQPSSSSSSQIPKLDTLSSSSSSSSSNSSSLFSALPPPKSETTPDFPLPPPKSKRVVQFRPPVPQPSPRFNEDDDDDDDEEAEEEKKRKKKNHVVHDTSVKSFLSSMPTPKSSGHSSLGALPSSLGSGRRSIIETESAPKISDVSGANVEVGVGSHVENNQENLVGGSNYNSYTSTYDEAGVAGDQGYANYGGYEAYANSSDYGGYGQYDSSSWSAGEPAATASLGGAESFARLGGKRRKDQPPTDLVEVKQDELMKNRPTQDKSKLTGIAFGPAYQPASTKGKPSKLHKRKHQIGSLYFDMKQREMELSERRAKGFLTKAETQAKYGW